jgi:hypothetical protein
MDELDDAEAGAVPRETLPHVETFPVLPSSPAMLGGTSCRANRLRQTECRWLRSLWAIPIKSR